MFHYGLCIAAFAFVASVLAFGHSASQARRDTMQQTASGSEVDAAGTLSRPCVVDTKTCRDH